MSPDISDILKDDASLEEFTKAVEDFNRAFCDAMIDGVDFTIKLEVRGNLHELIHARITADRWRRPKGVDARLEERKKELEV